MRAHTPKKPIPPELVILILEVALATPVSVPPSASDRQLRTSVLLLSHSLRDIFIKRIYDTVVLWSESAIHGFAETVRISPLLGSLVINLWAGNGGIRNECAFSRENSGTDDCVGCLEDIMSATTNLQRLYIAFGDPSFSRKIRCRIPETIRHLAIPQHWFPIYTLPASLTEADKTSPGIVSIHVRGQFIIQDILCNMRFFAQPFRLTLEIYDEHEDLRHLMRLIHKMYLLCRSGPQQCSVEFVSSPDKFERVKEVFTKIEAYYHGGFRPEGVSIGNQELDEEAQLRAWLSSDGHPL
ncbi:hypothetical protein FRC12_021190 [Ceratobasidium sp. 428]|nr:hypothetical protein FRC12_021190 [Ceratobasidium sp. 428]